MAKKNPFTGEELQETAPVAEEPISDEGAVSEEQVPASDEASTEETPTPEVPDEGAEEKPKSKRDSFRERVSARYPDLNMDDEDAYYDQMGSLMDDYEGYEKNSELLKGCMDRSPAMADMLAAAREQDDFDPVVWMVQQRGLDLDAARENPEYAEKLAEARKEYLAKQAKGEELLNTMKENIPSTIEAQQKALEDAGLGDQTEDVIGKIFQLADDISNGKWNPEIGVMLAKGAGYDEAVAGAHDAGKAEGLNTKVTDKLRKLDEQQEYVGGQQTPSQPEAPKKENKNMFLA